MFSVPVKFEILNSEACLVVGTPEGLPKFELHGLGILASAQVEILFSCLFLMAYQCRT